MKKVIVLSFLLISLASTAQDSYETKLKELFLLSGTQESYKAAIGQSVIMFKSQYPDISLEVWNRFEEELINTSIDDLTNMLIPVYQKYLTEKDLDGIIKFYKSKVGMKYAEKTPMILQESMQIGQQWGMKIGLELQKKLEEEGY